jgi:hypothetical protein
MDTTESSLSFGQYFGSGFDLNSKKYRTGKNLTLKSFFLLDLDMRMPIYTGRFCCKPRVEKQRNSRTFYFYIIFIFSRNRFYQRSTIQDENVNKKKLEFFLLSSIKKNLTNFR